MDFNFRIPHPKGEIALSITGGNAPACVAAVQMGHELALMLGASIEGAPVPVEPVTAQADPFTAPVFLSGKQTVETVAEAQGITVDGNPYPSKVEAPEPVEQAEEPKKRRGRPRKEAEPQPEPVEQADEGNESASDVAVASEEPSNTGEPAAADEELPEVTDMELQRFCGRLAAHFGGSDGVFALAAKHVPEGEMPRPTNIKDNTARWAFIRQAEEETGVKYHG